MELNYKSFGEGYPIIILQGGKTAMQFALTYPDLVNQLVVVDIAPKAYEGGHQTIFDALLSLDVSTIANRKAADAALLNKIPDFGVRQFLLKNLTNNKEGGYKWKMNLPIIYQNYNQILAALTSEETFDNSTLFIRGGQSDYILDEDLPTIKSFFPAATLATVDDAGHWVHAAAPAALLKLVTGFLNQA